VALARALIMRPKLLLLDEPLSALDLKLRQAMQQELSRIHQETGGTFLFVTHDQTEAFALADTLIVMQDGRVAQSGKPADIYRRPSTMFVAGFVGDVNVLSEGDIRKILRPENIRLAEQPSAKSKPCDLVGIAMLGTHLRCEVRLLDGRMLLVQQPDEANARAWRKGQRLHVSWHALDEVMVSA
jgi:spermidine/putrescine transport system ATP-binding protein